jgi:hypothetical protein
LEWTFDPEEGRHYHNIYDSQLETMFVSECLFFVKNNIAVITDVFLSADEKGPVLHFLRSRLPKRVVVTINE